MGEHTLDVKLTAVTREAATDGTHVRLTDFRKVENNMITGLQGTECQGDIGFGNWVHNYVYNDVKLYSQALLLVGGVISLTPSRRASQGHRWRVLLRRSSLLRQGDSNPRPLGHEPSALTAALCRDVGTRRKTIYRSMW